MQEPNATSPAWMRSRRFWAAFIIVDLLVALGIVLAVTPVRDVFTRIGRVPVATAAPAAGTIEAQRELAANRLREAFKKEHAALEELRRLRPDAEQAKSQGLVDAGQAALRDRMTAALDTVGAFTSSAPLPTDRITPRLLAIVEAVEADLAAITAQTRRALEALPKSR